MFNYSVSISRRRKGGGERKRRKTNTGEAIFLLVLMREAISGLISFSCSQKTTTKKTKSRNRLEKGEGEGQRKHTTPSDLFMIIYDNAPCMLIKQIRRHTIIACFPQHNDQGKHTSAAFLSPYSFSAHSYDKSHSLDQWSQQDRGSFYCAHWFRRQMH